MCDTCEKHKMPDVAKRPKKSKQRSPRKDQGKDTFAVQRFAAERARLHEYVAQTGRLELLSQGREPHYHILYNGVVNFGEGYETQTMGFRAMRAIADHFPDDKVLNFELGMIGLREVKIRDRTGLHDIMMQLGACTRTTCPNIRRLDVAAAAVDMEPMAEPAKNITRRPRGARYDANTR